MSQKVDGQQKVGAANIGYVSFSDYKQLDKIAIVGDQTETQTNGRYNQDNDLGNNKVYYPYTQKLDKYSSMEQKLTEQIPKLMHRKNRYNRVLTAVKNSIIYIYTYLTVPF